MTDEEETKPINTTWRIVTAYLVLLFNACTVWWILIYGHSENLLHQNALSWSYMMGVVVMAGLGFAQVIQYLPGLMGKK